MLNRTKSIYCVSLVIGSIALLITQNLSAQEYIIDLNQVKYPEVKNDFRMGHPGPIGKEIEVNSLYMTIGKEPVLPVMGEFHYSRYDHRYWKETLLKMKASGITIVSTYALWIYHEEIEGRMDWTGSNNLRKFIQLCEEVGLLVHLRFGPYCNAECRNGGLPDWLMRKTHIRKRYNDPLYLSYVRRWYAAVARQVDGLLYKDGGPIMGLQLENEYVTKGHVIPHLMELKKMAIEVGFDVPVYSMTHWLSSDYPKKEIIPYAGYYIETPWFKGHDELPVSNFQFFSYNRLSDNIGTDLIKMEGDVQSLNSQEVESPYFTCEVGLGTPSFYGRRPIVPEEMAGANINLRLGCGVNLMGYYMYSGGSNQVGKLTTLESSTSRISYDYQAPIKEFGTLGVVMREAKKYNYFMNDFGSQLAEQIAYLPTSNNDTENLQWAVRSKDNKGFLFCSNYLYKRSRKQFDNVQFKIKLKNESLEIPRKPTSIVDGAYFLWPFNMKMEDILLKYATTQPISKVQNGKEKMWAFFQDDEIEAEYFFAKECIKSIHVSKGNVKEEANGFFVSILKPGTDCVIEIEQKDGTQIRILTLTAEQSDLIWKVQNGGIDYLALTESGIFMDNDEMTLFAEENKQEILLYPGTTTSKMDGIFSIYDFEKEMREFPVELKDYRPMEKSEWITTTSKKGKSVITKSFNASSLASVKQAVFRCASSGSFTAFLNDEQLDLRSTGGYFIADLADILNNGKNNIRFESNKKSLRLIAEIEALMSNGSRMVWNTDATWESKQKQSEPVKILGKQGENGLETFAWQKEDGVEYYEIELPADIDYGNEELRLVISFNGDRADAFLGDDLISDYLFDGSDWVIGINRFSERLQDKSLVIRAKAFESAHPEIYFEKFIDTSELDEARVNKVKLRPEYRFKVKLK